MSDYTPTTAHVRGAWVEVNYLESSGNIPQTAWAKERNNERAAEV